MSGRFEPDHNRNMRLIFYSTDFPITSDFCFILSSPNFSRLRNTDLKLNVFFSIII